LEIGLENAMLNKTLYSLDPGDMLVTCLQQNQFLILHSQNGNSQV